MSGDLLKTDSATVTSAASSGNFESDCLPSHLTAVSSQAGFLPICLAHVPVEAFAAIPVYIRPHRSRLQVDRSTPVFVLHCTEHAPFTISHLRRLTDQGIRFVYIPISTHDRFRQQAEAQLHCGENGQATATSFKSTIVYETSLELVNELLGGPEINLDAQGLTSVSRSVTTLILDDPLVFSHLFAASHHDFYTATHLVNVATWMVSLAYGLGYRAQADLEAVCQAGLLHDIGKVEIPGDILNKRTPLTDAEFSILKSHPDLGAKYLKEKGITDPVIQAVAHQHHERLDGKGYPRGLKGNQIHPIAMMCAVVDSFDAMTSLRPFKSKTLSVVEALKELSNDVPGKYDGKVVEAWTKFFATTSLSSTPAPPSQAGRSNRRLYPRFNHHCQAIFESVDSHPPFSCNAEVHDLSRSGMGLFSPTPVDMGLRVRVKLLYPNSTRVRQKFIGLIVRNGPTVDGRFDVGLNFITLGQS